MPTTKPAAPAYQLDAQATAEAIAILQRAGIAAAHIRVLHDMTWSARERLNRELAAHLRPSA